MKNQQPCEPLDCEQVRAEMCAQLAGELEPDLGVRVAGHLETCAACHELWCERQSTLQLLDAWQVPVPPPGLIAAPGRVDHSRRGFWRAAAVGLLVGLAAFGLCLWVGTQVRWDTHQLVVSFGARPGPSGAVLQVTPASLQGVVRGVYDERLGLLGDDLADLWLRRSELEAQRQVDLVEALAQRWSAERLQVLAALDEIDRRTDGRTRVLRDMLLGLVAREEGGSPREQKQIKKP